MAIAETTIQLSLKQADVLRQGLWNEYVEALEEVHKKVGEYLAFRPWEADKNKIPTIQLVHFPRADLEGVAEKLRGFKWDFGIHTPTFTADTEWLREFLYNNMDRAAQSLHESDAEHFDSWLETVNTYKELLDQVNEREPAKVEA